MSEMFIQDIPAKEVRVGNPEKIGIANQAMRIVEDGTVTYLGIAPIGSASSAAVWQMRKIDETSGAVITWADGNDNYDNVFDNYASLTYQ